MSRTGTLALILFVALHACVGTPRTVTAQEASMPSDFAEPAICGPSWYAGAEAIFFTRDRTDRRSISADVDFMGTTTVLMSTNDLDFNYQSGVRFTLGRRIGGGALELSYFGVEHYDAAAQVTSAQAASGDLQSAMGSFERSVQFAPFDGADLHRISYSSNLHNAEINFRHALSASESWESSWLVGVRYLKVHEKFDFHSTVNDWMGNGRATGLLGATTDNDLIGAQLGGDLLWHATQRFTLQVSAKGALLGNSVVQHGYTVYDMPLPGASGRYDSAASDVRLSSIVEAGLFGILQVTSRIKLRAGYQVLMVGGLALAPTQLNFGDDPVAGDYVKQQGNTVFHGPSCGLEAAW